MSSKTTKTQRQIIVGFVVIAVIALLFGMWFQYNIGNKKNHSVSLNLASATVLPQPRALSAFQLTDDTKKTFTNSNFANHWSLLFFGFTHCPELCPTTLSVLNQSYQILQTMHQKPMPQVIFISVDPQRDNAQRIAEYLASFNNDFIGATGSKQQLDQLTQELNIMYMKIADQGEQQGMYSIDHSGTILMIDPKGQLYAVFTTPHDAKAIAKDVSTIIKHYSTS